MQLSDAWAQLQARADPQRSCRGSAAAGQTRSEMASAHDQDFGGRSGRVARLRCWRPLASWRGRASGDIVAEKAWLPVTDSVVTALNVKLSNVAANETGTRLTLSAADMATLIFRSPRRRQAPVDSIEARIDSVLWIRGRLRGGSRFELGGDVRMSRRGVAEFRVDHLNIGGVDADSARTARLVVGVRSRSADADRMRFEVPLFVAEVAIMDGAAKLMTRARR